jgi:RIO-like serine/threonine protein kinase
MFKNTRHKIDVIIRITYSTTNLKYFNRLKKLYTLIEDCQYVPKMTFLDNQIEMKYCGKSLDLIKKCSNEEKEIIKQQIILFIKYINKRNIAHRDLWIKNICWDGEQIWVIDWEYIISHSPNNITDHYDLTGKGLTSPELTNGMNIFHSSKKSISNWLLPVSISLNDFV